MRFRILMIVLLFSCAAQAQYKSFMIGDKRDTLNIVDARGQKQGKWVVRVPALRGNPAYEEEGLYKDDRKEGTWRRFNLLGDPIAMENYRWGNKNGLCRYYTPNGIEHEESWRAINPDKLYDTVDVKDPVSGSYERVVVKNEGNSLKHGTWRYFDPIKGQLLGSETYFLDKLREPGESDPITGLVIKPTVAVDSTKAKPADKPKPKEVMEFEKKTSGKKKALRTGSTGG